MLLAGEKASQDVTADGHESQSGVLRFPMATAAYYCCFPVVEIQQTFYNMPRIRTAERWRKEAMTARARTDQAEFEETMADMIDLHTFSIVARDPKTGEYGVAVSTARPNVGSLVPFVSRRGAIATQGRVNSDLGRQGLAHLEQGVPIRLALRTLLETDPDREIRQVHAVDGSGAFCHTGARCVEWCGHLEGDGFTVAGNMLTGPQVIQDMAGVFRSSTNDQRELPECLLLALEAGQKAGGDKRGKQSAALLVASSEPRMYHNLRVDHHTEPVVELRRIYNLVVVHMAQIEREYGAEGVRLFGRVKY